ncbi:MAG: 3-methyl-2-oxobutanoate dehydrogenase subunit VorB [Candidatus Omnitrophica bacterium]|nr:3-methyl-2-oxobutanoate dehydrogenase subunit VorB [Candidatus Omnitrophota bacterium]
MLISGNEAIGAGAIRAGCVFYAGYPITPQNELTSYMAEHMPAAGRVFIQAESELAAINMVFGAAAAGARAMTSSSSPGVSLKQEGISYIAGAQLPAVIVNIMRGGPGLGNISPSQSDYFQATRSGGHGDYHSIVLAPASVPEAYTLMQRAFALSETYRGPVILLGDGMLGQMMEVVELDTGTKAPAVTKKPWALTGCKGRQPNIVRSIYLKEGALEKFNLLLQKKYHLIRQREQRYESFAVDDARVIIVAYGTMARIAKQAVMALRKKGKKAGLIRPITLWPFPASAFSVLGRPRQKFLVTEMSYGQMLEDVRLTLEGRAEVSFLGRAGGGIPSEEEITARAMRLLQ